MKQLRPLTLTIIVLLTHLTSNGQLISKKESAAIDDILAESSRQFKPSTHLIQHVDILSMTDMKLQENQDVLIEDGVIRKIGKDIQRQGATVIDGTSKYLMPGLTDMHVHLFDNHPLKNTWILNLLINGVTSVRDLYGSPEKLVLRERIGRNEVLAPNLYQSGRIINGIDDKFATYAPTAQKGREIVQAHKKAGYDFIKVYDGLSKDVYKAIVDEANKQDIPVVGHVPDQVTFSGAIDAGQKSIEHLTGYFKWEGSQVKIIDDDYAEVTAESETWNCPTIYNHYLNGSREGAANAVAYAESSGTVPDGISKMWSKRSASASKEVNEIVDKYGASNFESLNRIILNLYQSNAKLIAGTDSGNLPFLVPGYSLHQELKLLSEIGIPTYEVLKMATVNAAQAMNKSDEFGTVEVGKRADLLLLNSNPLENVENLTDKAGLMVRGIWLSKEDIEQLTNEIKLAFGN